MPDIANLLKQFANLTGGTPLVILLAGGGLFFMLYSRFYPIRHLWSTIQLLRKGNSKDDTQGISQWQALASAIAATVGMGNISGVAVAISMGGPGALFWMWVSAFLGMATKFFTCSLAVMYRQIDENGKYRGGPMYYILFGLGKKWHFWAGLFSVVCLFGSLPIFQANQLTQILTETLSEGKNYTEANVFWIKLSIGLILALLVAIIIMGGLKRIAQFSVRIVPAMVLIYVGLAIWIIGTEAARIPECFMLIWQDAFTGKAVLGGSLGAVMLAGVRRAVFSNEAGIGTAPLFHGDSSTQNPISEGLVASLGPLIDTIIVCTMTALVVLLTDAWKAQGLEGISITLLAFETAIPDWGSYLLLFCTFVFAFTTLFTAYHFGEKAFYYISNGKWMLWHKVFYISTIVIGAAIPISAVLDFIDGMYSLMAIPTMLGAFWLAPKVMELVRKES